MVTFSAKHWPPTQDNKAAGIALAYLSSLAVSAKVFVNIKGYSKEFYLPEPANNVPLIIIAAGTSRTFPLHKTACLACVLTIDLGLAPFCSFVQERAAQVAASHALAAALLFYRCRSLNNNPYAKSLKRWEQLSAVSVCRAYSCALEQLQGCRHVQDRVYHNRADYITLFLVGAQVAVCVPECAVADVRRTLASIIKKSGSGNSQGEATKTQSKGVATVAAERQLNAVWHEWTSHKLTA
jgi:cytochrome P450/NADPH-cytochrome P450 reductase